MRARVDKAALKAQLLAQLAAALAHAELAHAAAIEGATHTEARAENSKDTRGLEQSYLARGQAQRVGELAAALADVTAFAPRAFTDRDAIALGTIVTIEEGDADAQHRWFLAPAGGGSTLADGIVVVTPSSPLGSALLGKRVDDDVEIRLPGRVRTLAIRALE